MVRSTHDHEDHIRYWLTDTVSGGQQKPEVFTVMTDDYLHRNQKSIIALLNYREFSFINIEIFIITAYYCARWDKSSAYS